MSEDVHNPLSKWTQDTWGSLDAYAKHIFKIKYIIQLMLTKIPFVFLCKILWFSTRSAWTVPLCTSHFTLTGVISAQLHLLFINNRDYIWNKELKTLPFIEQTKWLYSQSNYYHPSVPRPLLSSQFDGISHAINPNKEQTHWASTVTESSFTFEETDKWPACSQFLKASALFH